MGDRRNHSAGDRVPGPLALLLAGLGLMVVASFVWWAASSGPQLAYAHPIDPPEGYPKLSVSVKNVVPTLVNTDGATLYYAIEIRNTGAYTATGTMVTDTIPQGTTYNGDAWASVPPPPTYTQGLLTWQGEVGFDDTVVLTFSVAVSPLVSGLVHNTAVLSHPLIAKPVVVTATTMVTDRPILRLEKSALPEKPGPNKPMTYTLVVVNEGQPATNLPITLTDRVPLSTSLRSWSEGGTTNDAQDVLTWTRDVTLDTGESTQFTFSVDVADVPSGTVIANREYQVTSPETGLTAGVPYSVTIIDPILYLSKEVWPDPPGSNRELTYTLELLNAGSLATGLVITDRVPAGVEYRRGGSESNGVVSWSLPSLDTGESAQFTFTAYVSDVMDIVVSNDAYRACCLEGICVDGEVLSRTVEGPHLEAFALVEPIAHKPGGGTDTEVWPTLVIRNLGPGNALAAKATLTYYRIQVQSSDITVDPPLGTPPPLPDGPDCGDKCLNYFWIGDLDHGQTVTFATSLGESTIGGAEGTPYSTTVLITDDLSNMSAPPASDTAIGLVTHYANVVPTKSAPPVVGPGELLTYTIRADNRAMTTDLPPVLTDVVPLGTTFVWASDGGITTTVSDRVVVSWTLPLLSVGDGVVRYFTVRTQEDLISGTLIVNDDYSITGYGNVMTDAVTSGPPVITIVKEAGLDRSFKRVTPERPEAGPGNVLTYTLHLVNTGPVDLAGVTVEDWLPWPASTYQRDAVASAGQIFSDIVSVHWTGDVLAFSTEALTFTVLLDPDFTGYVTNTALISHPRLSEPVIVHAVAYVVPNQPILRLTKSASPSTVDIGDEILYTLRVANEGKRATGVVVLDTIPKRAAYVPGSASGGGELLPGEPARLRWVVPALDPLDSRTFTFRVTAQEGCGKVVNRSFSASSHEGVRVAGAPVAVAVTGAQECGVYLPVVLRNGP